MGERIALHDADKTGYPNFALMKISAWHKACGDTVEWFAAGQQYDRVYSSKVFTFTPVDPDLPADCIKGGTGYDIASRLPDHIDACFPDYSLYELDYSIGFTTRGCPHTCKWCFVPTKEGREHPVASIKELILPGHDRIVLMDNNPLALQHGVEQMEEIARLGIRVDYNQGLDARLIDDGIARLLSKMKWSTPLRLACDGPGMISVVQKAVQHLRWHNVKPRQYFCYMLVEDVEEAVERARFLKGLYIDPFAQPYIGSDGSLPTREQRRFARWMNTHMVSKRQTWEDYKAERGERL